MTPEQIGHDEDRKAWGQTWKRVRRGPRWWQSRRLHSAVTGIILIGGIVWITWSIVDGIAGP